MTFSGKVNFPMQPIVLAKDGVIRFKENRIVSALLKAAAEGERLDLNDISIRVQTGTFDRGEWEQLLQLNGISVSGFGDFDVDPRVVKRADKIARKVRAP